MSTMRRFGALALGAAALAGLAGCVYSPPSFSPDGKKIAVANERELMILNVGGTERVRVPGAKCTLLPLWSPEGRYVAYIGGDRSDAIGAARLYDTRTGRTQRLKTRAIWPLAWREDGRRLALLSDTRDPELIELYDVDQAAVVQQIGIPAGTVSGMAYGPCFWISGTDNLAFVGNRALPPYGADVYVSESGELRQVTHAGDVVGVAAARDGRRLIWLRATPRAAPRRIERWECDLGSGGVRRLPFASAVRGGDGRTAPMGLECCQASISPDLRRVAVGASRSGSAECWVMNADGTHARRVVLPGARWSGLFASWSADSTRLAVQCGEFHDNRRRKWTVLGTFVLRADGTGGRRVLFGRQEG